MGQLELGNICLHPVRCIERGTRTSGHLRGADALEYTVGWERT